MQCSPFLLRSTDADRLRELDVIKAVALGATAVGLGRPFIYSYSAYGQEGVEHAMQVRLSSLLPDDVALTRSCFLSRS